MALAQSRAATLAALGIDPAKMKRQALAPISDIIPLGQSKVKSVSSMIPKLPDQYTVGLPEGYATRDSGVGKYEILDPTGAVVGTGYDDLDTTLLEYQKQNLLGSIQETRIPGSESSRRGLGVPEQVYYTSPYLGSNSYDESGNLVSSGPQYRTRAEIEAALSKYYATPDLLAKVYGPSDWSGITSAAGIPMYGDAAKWEALGIMMNPQLQNTGTKWGNILGGGPSGSSGIYTPIGSTNTSNLSPYAAQLYGLPRTNRSNTPGTTAVETLTGEQTLYGSKPVFSNGQLVGYQMDRALFSPEQIAAIDAAGDGSRLQMQAGPLGAAYAWNRRSSATQSSLGREYLPGWGLYSAPMEGTRVFIPKEVVGELPGFKNKASYDYENWSGGSFFDKLLSNPASLALGVLGGFALGPLAGAIGNTLGTGAAASGALSGALIGSGTAALTGGDILKGAALGGLGGGLSGYASAANPAAALTKNPLLQKVINRGAVGGLTGAAGAGLYGGDIKQGALAGLAGGAIGGALGGDTKLSQQLGGFAGRMIGSLLFPQPAQQTAYPQAASRPAATSPLASLAAQPNFAALPQRVQQRIAGLYGAA